jgi:hypothetical protein
MPAGLNPDAMGPVDVAVIAFDSGVISTDIASTLANLQAKGVVRIIDLAVVGQDAAGRTSFSEGNDPGLGEAFAGLADGEFDLLSEDDLGLIAADLDPGQAALVLVWENVWAAPFGATVRAAGGRLTGLERIPRPVVLAAIAALDDGEE